MVFQTYLRDENISDEIDWQFDIIIVFLNIKDKNVKDIPNQYVSRDYHIKYMENIII